MARAKKAAPAAQVADESPEYLEIEVTEEVRLPHLGIVLRPGQTVSANSALRAELAGKIKQKD